MKLPLPTRVVHTAAGDELYIEGVRWHNVTRVGVGTVKEGQPTVLTLTISGPVVVEGAQKAEEAPKATAGKKPEAP